MVDHACMYSTSYKHPGTMEDAYYHRSTLETRPGNLYLQNPRRNSDEEAFRRDLSLHWLSYSALTQCTLGKLIIYLLKLWTYQWPEFSRLYTNEMEKNKVYTQERKPTGGDNNTLQKKPMFPNYLHPGYIFIHWRFCLLHICIHQLESYCTDTQ